MNDKLNKIIMLRDLGKFKQSLELCFQYLPEDPENIIVYSEIVLNLINLKSYRDAEYYARILIQKDPEDAWAYYVLAYAIEKQKKLEDALTFIETAIQLNPDDPIYYEFIADIYCQWRNYEKALIYAEQGLSVDPENEHCLSCRIRCLTALDKLVELPNAIKEGLQFAPECFLTQYQIGLAYWRLNDIEKAKEHISISLHLDPEFEDAQIAIKEIELVKKQNQ